MCAQAMVLGEIGSEGDSVTSVTRYVKGMIFLGTPFAGSDLAKWGELVSNIFNWVKKTDSRPLRTLNTKSEDLKTLGMTFPNVIRKRNEEGPRVNVCFFYEELDTHHVRVSSSDTRHNIFSLHSRSLRRSPPPIPASGRFCLFVRTIPISVSSLLQMRTGTKL